MQLADVMIGAAIEAGNNLAGLRSGGRWRALPLRRSGSVAVGGDEIPLADTGFWWALYTQLAPGKAALLAPLVPGDERARAAPELAV